MAKPTYTAPPNSPPVLGSPDFSSNAQGYLGWFPTFGTYCEALAAWLQTEYVAALSDGSASAPALAFAADSNTGIRRISADKFALVAGGVDQLIIENGQPVGGALVQASPYDATAGHLLTLGAFGWGDDAPDTLDNIDRHDLVNAVYKVDNSVTLGTLPPINTVGDLALVLRPTPNQTTQIYSVPNAGVSFIRKSNAATSWGPWRLDYDQGSILGTVNQSGGVPTGALIERGSNTNGEYVRFADGTQICRHQRAGVDINISYAGLYRSAPFTWTFPAAFVAGATSANGPQVFGGVLNGAGLSVNSPYGGRTTAADDIRAAAGASITATPVHLTAIGRWF